MWQTAQAMYVSSSSDLSDSLIILSTIPSKHSILSPSSSSSQAYTQTQDLWICRASRLYTDIYKWRHPLARVKLREVVPIESASTNGEWGKNHSCVQSINKYYALSIYTDAQSLRNIEVHLVRTNSLLKRGNSCAKNTGGEWEIPLLAELRLSHPITCRCCYLIVSRTL